MRISDWGSDVCSSDLAQQIYTGGSRFNAESTVPAIVVIGMVRELAPVLAGLMVAGRVSSAMAAELGTMRVTEQLDAMVTLRTDPYRYRSDEHTSELQSLMRISHAVFCLQKKKKHVRQHHTQTHLQSS